VGSTSAKAGAAVKKNAIAGRMNENTGLKKGLMVRISSFDFLGFTWSEKIH
jgi:hypothetical protein